VVAGILFYHILLPCCICTLPLEAEESLCVVFEACIHALEGAQVPHDHMGMIEFIFILSVFFGLCTNQ
jgi:hypothetical protein